MKSNASLLRVLVVSTILTLLPTLISAQGSKGGGSGRPVTGLPGPTVSNTPIQPAPTPILFVSGKVLMEGGGIPPEPVVIEKICNGAARREGYTDNKGTYQIQVDQTTGFQDASETTNTDLTNDPKVNAKLNQLKMNFQGCEIRAVLSGYVSTSAMLHLEGSVWQYDLPPIFLKPLENMPGTTISMTSLNAPNDAKHAYEKGRKAYDQEKLMDAEKELDKAVKIYPGFAAAWSLLGDIHQRLKQTDQAVKDYSQALAADSKYVNPAFGLALIAIQQKRWQDALQLTDQVSKLNSAAFPSAYFYNAVANYNLGKPELAEISARKFKTLDTQHRHPDVCLLLSQILTNRRDYPGAAQELREYLAVAPSANNADAVREQLRKLEQVSVAKQQK